MEDPKQVMKILEGDYAERYKKLGDKLTTIFDEVQKARGEARGTRDMIRAFQRIGEKFKQDVDTAFKEQGLTPPKYPPLQFPTRENLLAQARTQLKEKQQYARDQSEMREEHERDLAEKYERIYKSVEGLLRTWEKEGDPAKRNTLWDTFIGFARTNLGLTTKDLTKIMFDVAAPPERIAKQVTRLALKRKEGVSEDYAREAEIAYFKPGGGAR